MKSGDKIRTLAGGTRSLPFKEEHLCFNQRTGCANMASWRLEAPHLMLHFCDECKDKQTFGDCVPMDVRPASGTSSTG